MAVALDRLRLLRRAFTSCGGDVELPSSQQMRKLTRQPRREGKCGNGGWGEKLARSDLERAPYWESRIILHDNKEAIILTTNEREAET